MTAGVIKECCIQAWPIKSTNCWALNFVNSLQIQLGLRHEEEEEDLMFQKSEMLHLFTASLSRHNRLNLCKEEREDSAESRMSL